MKNYLSFGGGVNSVAMYLMLMDQGVEFEAVFVDHGSDWPETYEYVKYFISTGHPITILKPDVENCASLLEYCHKYRMTPSRIHRWCTDKFKVGVVYKYVDRPCFMFIGIDAGEANRAKINSNKGVENRWPLIEWGVDRDGCKRLITKAGLNMPMKSGCFYCPFQRVGQWRKLRKEHPNLFCEAQKLERIENEKRAEKGKDPFYIHGKNRPLEAIIGMRDRQMALPGHEEDEYPPCECML